MSQTGTQNRPDTDPLAIWWSTSQGSAIVAAEAELLRDALDTVFGWELLQVGAWGRERELLAAARTRHQALAGTLEQQRAGVRLDLVARAAHLPIASDSVDAVLLAHALEFAADPHALLREVDRILTGEGQLLVLGFRPWSPR